MKIAVMGSGGVGGYFGGRLAAAGSDVTFIARGAYLAAIRKNDLYITSQHGDAYIANPKTAETIAEVTSADLVLVGVKLWDTEVVTASLAPLAKAGTAILSLQSGVQKDDILKTHVQAGSVMGGVCNIAATIAEPGVIAHSGPMQSLVFGEYGGVKSARGEAFLQACTAAGIDAQFSDAIERLIWEKFVFLVGLSGMTALYRTRLG